MNAIFWATIHAPNWDFMAYYLNGKYFFNEGHYFEIYRAPFVAFCLGVLSTITKNFYFTAIFYSILTTLAFIYFANKVSEAYQLDKKVYYIVLFTTPLLWYRGLRVGSELMSLTLLLAFLYFLKNNKNIAAGISLSLASLTRYELLILLPLLFTTKDLKNIIFRLFAFAFPWLIWLIYNYLTWGAALYSLVNSYALNIYFRKYLWQAPNPLHFLTLGSALIGSIYYLYIKIVKKLSVLTKKDELLLLYMIGALMYSYYSTPLKFDRYVYALIAPLSILAASSFNYMNFKNKVFRLSLMIFLTFTLAIYSVAWYQYYQETGTFQRVKESLHYLNKSQTYYSDLWVHLNFYGINALPLEQLCNGSQLIIPPHFKYALVFYNPYCVVRNASLIKNTTINNNYLYSFSYTNLSDMSALYLDHLKEYSLKLGYDIDKETCIAFFKIPFLCRDPFI